MLLFKSFSCETKSGDCVEEEIIEEEMHGMCLWRIRSCFVFSQKMYLLFCCCPQKPISPQSPPAPVEETTTYRPTDGGPPFGGEPAATDASSSAPCLHSTVAAAEEGKAMARRIDRLSRQLFPVAFMTFNLVYWIVYIDPLKAIPPQN